MDDFDDCQALIKECHSFIKKCFATPKLCIWPMLKYKYTVPFVSLDQFVPSFLARQEAKAMEEPSLKP